MEGAHAGLCIYLVLTLGCLFVFAGCGSDESQAPVTPSQSAETSIPEGTPTENTVVGEGQAESTKDEAFKLNTRQPVPPNFEEAYGRRARLVVQFYKLDQDSLSYPQGLSVDRKVNMSMMRLSTKYPTIEFFSYSIKPWARRRRSEPAARRVRYAGRTAWCRDHAFHRDARAEWRRVCDHQPFRRICAKTRLEPGALRSRGGTGRGQHERC